MTGLRRNTSSVVFPKVPARAGKFVAVDGAPSIVLRDGVLKLVPPPSDRGSQLVSPWAF
jgi:hypothetical protein